jgi:hypothetical protein
MNLSMPQYYRNVNLVQGNFQIRRILESDEGSVRENQGKFITLSRNLVHVLWNRKGLIRVLRGGALCFCEEEE